MTPKTKQAGVVFRLLLVLAATGTILRFFTGVFDNPLSNLFSDPARHWDNAVHFMNPGLMGGCDPIGYQVYVFILLFVTGGQPLWIGIVTGLLSAVMPWLFYSAARSFGMPKALALAYWAAMAWLPSFFAIYRYFMMETLLLPLLGLGLWMSGRCLRKRDVSSFLIMTAVWTLAVLTKAQAIPLALIFWAYALVLVRGKAVAVLGSLACVTLLLIPNAIRSKSILGFYAPLGSGYIARIMHESGATHTRFLLPKGTWIYSSPSCYVPPLEPINYWRIERGSTETTHVVQVDLANERTDWETALQAASRSPTQYLLHGWENFVLFLFAPSWPDSGRDYLSGWLNHHLRWIWAVVLFQVLVGNAFIFWKRCFPVVPVATTAMVVIMMFQNSVTMEGRYRKPVEPLLILNVLWLWASTSRRQIKDNQSLEVEENSCPMAVAPTRAFKAKYS